MAHKNNSLALRANLAKGVKTFFLKALVTDRKNFVEENVEIYLYCNRVG